MMPEEKVIIKKFKEGDAAAFDSLYRCYSKKLYNFFLGLLKDPDDAGEIELKAKQNRFWLSNLG